MLAEFMLGEDYLYLLGIRTKWIYGFWKPHYSRGIRTKWIFVDSIKNRSKVRTALSEVALSEDPLYG